MHICIWPDRFWENIYDGNVGFCNLVEINCRLMRISPLLFLVFICLQTGPKDLTEHSQGVNYRSLGHLFYLAEQRRDTFCYDVAVQMIEIYNEQVRDLLSGDGLNKKYPLSTDERFLYCIDLGLFAVGEISA